MRFLEQTIAASPDRAGFLRVAARFEMERRGAGLDVWFDLPEFSRDSIARGGDPWAILMLPIAMTAGEDISLPLPVDPLLVENLKGLMAVWHDWFPELREVAIEAPAASARDAPPPTRAGGGRAMFFSGGIDSFFTLLRHDKTATGCGSGPVDTLIFVGGFDIPVTDEAEIDLATRRLQAAARDFGKAFLPVMTNLRELETPYRLNWILAHGCAMGTIAHLLGEGFSEVLISSTYKYGLLLRIGSHPMTDPLLSSRGLRVIHDGASISRDDKIARVATCPEALRNLRVCYSSRKHDNCGACAKCLHTMAALDLLGFARQASCFDWSKYRLEALAELFLSDLQIYRVERLLMVARATGRQELEAALQRSIGRTMVVRRGARIVSRLPFLWRYEYQARRYLLRHTAGGGNRLLQRLAASRGRGWTGT